MNKKRFNVQKILGAGVIAAVGASLCCIVPLLALVAGISGLASMFSWVEPLRPYLIGVTVLTLGFAWHQKLKPKKEIECDCETDEKSSFLQSKNFLVIVTVFAILLLSFPYYNSAFFVQKKKTKEFSKIDLTTVDLQISGMTCEGCEANVSNYASAAGADFVISDYKSGKATVKFDKNKTNIDSIVTKIESLGYKIIEKKENQDRIK